VAAARTAFVGVLVAAEVISPAQSSLVGMLVHGGGNEGQPWKQSNRICVKEEALKDATEAEAQRQHCLRSP